MYPYNSRFDFVGSRIILSPILSIPNSNYTQKHKYLRGNLFLLEGKNHETNFELISLFSNQLQYFLCDSQLKKNLSYFPLHLHTIL